MAPPEAKCSQPDTWKALGASGLDVCQVAQELITKTCPSAGIHELDLDKENWYTVWKLPDEALECTCTHVMYNLLTACAGCQNWDTVAAANSSAKWPSIKDYYGSKCPEHPEHEPNSAHQKRDPKWSTTPPNWASVVETPTFNLTQVLQQADGDSQAQASNSGAATAATTTETLTTVTATAMVAPETSSSGPNIGAIVGGVIGGLAFLAALIGLFFWLHRRRRRARDVAPSAEFIKPEYYATPPLLSAGHDRRDSDYHDDIEEAEPSAANRQSWRGGLVTNRMQEDDDDGDMLPPFTRGAYIGPSPHEKGHPERRDTGDSDLTMRTDTTTTLLLSSESPVRRSGPSDHLS